MNGLSNLKGDSLRMSKLVVIVGWKDGTEALLQNKADRHKSRAPSNQFPADRRTDRPTDRVAYRVACTRLKTSFFVVSHDSITRCVCPSLLPSVVCLSVGP